MLIRLQNVAVDLQLRQHVPLQVGTLMAGTDKFYIRVKGVGGHGGTPHLVKDTVVAASAVVMNLQPLVSRETDPAEGGIVGVTLINSGKLIVNALSLCAVTWRCLLVLDTIKLTVLTNSIAKTSDTSESDMLFYDAALVARISGVSLDEQSSYRFKYQTVSSGA